MAITPQPGYQVDPNNPNGVIPIPGYTPGQTPPPSTPPSTPAPTQTPATSATQTPSTPSTGLPDTSFLGLLNSMSVGLKTNNALVDQKNAVVQAMLGGTVDPATLAKLPKDIQDIIQGGNRDQLMLQAQVLNDSISGKNNTVAQSIQYLTQGYQNSIQNVQTQRQFAIDTLNKFIVDYGSRAGTMIKATFGQPFIDQLKAEGIDVMAASQAAGIPTVTEQRYVPTGTSGVSGYDLSSYASDPNYSNTITSIQSNIGSIADAQSAQSYISQYYPNSPVTGDMIMGAAQQYNVDPSTIMAILQKETQFGTDGSKGALQNNFGNVGNTDSVMASGKSVPMGSPQDGVNAIAQWLSTHKQNVNPVVQSYIDGFKTGAVTSVAQVPVAYRSSVLQGMTEQSVQTPQGDRRWLLASNALLANYIALPEYTLTANAMPYLLKIDAAMTVPGSVSDQELLDSFTKLSTAGGVISDAQVRVITGGQSASDWVSIASKKLAEGGVLSDNQRQQIYDLGHASYENLKKGYQPIYNEATKKLQDSGIPESYWTLPDLNSLSSLTEAAVGDTSTSNSGGNSTSGGDSQNNDPLNLGI